MPRDSIDRSRWQQGKFSSGRELRATVDKPPCGEVIATMAKAAKNAGIRHAPVQMQGMCRSPDYRRKPLHRLMADSIDRGTAADRLLALRIVDANFNRAS